MVLTAEKTLLVASLAPASNAEAMEARAVLADLPPAAAVELRLDAMAEEPGVRRAARVLRRKNAHRDRPLRSRGRRVPGERGGREADLLEGALAAGFDLVDVEFRARRAPERFPVFLLLRKISLPP